jgi:hypothetical protein
LASVWRTARAGFRDAPINLNPVTRGCFEAQARLSPMLAADIKSLVDGREFLYEVVKIYANQND